MEGLLVVVLLFDHFYVRSGRVISSQVLWRILILGVLLMVAVLIFIATEPKANVTFGPSRPTAPL
jgi:hypothetical protein